MVFFFFNDTATTEIYTLSLHDALPISEGQYQIACARIAPRRRGARRCRGGRPRFLGRSEEHTSELQSRSDLVCRLLLEKKKVPPLPQPSTPTSHPHAVPPAPNMRPATR